MEGKGRRSGRIYLVWSTHFLPCHPSSIHDPTSMVVPGVAEKMHGACALCLWRGTGISAFVLITALEGACFCRDGQGMSRQSVLAVVPSSLPQWSNVVLDGNVAVLGDRDRLAARASASAPSFRPIECSTSIRSGYGREACPSLEHWGPHMVIRTPGYWYLGPVRSSMSTWVPAPASPGPLAPALSKLSPKSLLSGALQQKPFITCVIASAPTPAASTSCKIRTTYTDPLHRRPQ